MSSHYYWQTRDESTGEFRDVEDADISRVRDRADEKARVRAKHAVSQEPGLSFKDAFVAEFKNALAEEIATLKE